MLSRIAIHSSVYTLCHWLNNRKSSQCLAIGTSPGGQLREGRNETRMVHKYDVKNVCCIILRKILHAALSIIITPILPCKCLTRVCIQYILHFLLFETSSASLDSVTDLYEF